jgi:hypothetical protein
MNEMIDDLIGLSILKIIFANDQEGNPTDDPEHWESYTVIDRRISVVDKSNPEQDTYFYEYVCRVDSSKRKSYICDVCELDFNDMILRGDFVISPLKIDEVRRILKND